MLIVYNVGWIFCTDVFDLSCSVKHPVLIHCCLYYFIGIKLPVKVIAIVGNVLIDVGTCIYV